MNEIIKESGAPKGSLYYYLPEGREQIAAEAVLHAGRTTTDRIRTGLAQSGNLSKVIYDLITRIADHVELSGFGAGGPLTAVAMETATQSERINIACREAYQMIVESFREKLIQGGISKTKAADLAIFITAAIEGGIILSRTHHSGDPLRLVARQLRDLLSNLKGEK